jgi:hypothetical protein
MNVAIPEGPPFFRFSEAEESKRVLGEIGFTGVEVRNVPQTWRLPASDALFVTMYYRSVRNAALLRAQSPEALKRIREEMSARAAAHGNELPMPAVLVSGRKMGT